MLHFLTAKVNIAYCLFCQWCQPLRHINRTLTGFSECIFSCPLMSGHVVTTLHSRTRSLQWRTTDHACDQRWSTPCPRQEMLAAWVLFLLPMTPSKQRIYYIYAWRLITFCHRVLCRFEITRIGAKVLLHKVRRTKTIHIEEALTGRFPDKFNVKSRYAWLHRRVKQIVFRRMLHSLFFFCLRNLGVMSTKTCKCTGPYSKALNAPSSPSDNAVIDSFTSCMSSLCLNVFIRKHFWGVED